MYLNHMMNRFKKAETGMLLRDSVNAISAAKIQETHSLKIDTDSINERLGKGDKTALKELEAQKIAYTLAENANGYTVKYSYNGTNYTITYYAKEEIDVKPEKPVTGETTTETGVDDVPAQSETEEPSFDYSDVDKGAKAEDFYNEDNIPDNKKLTMLLGGKGGVDSGAWDDLFAELEKMKPQLLDYMKQQIESVGRVYDEEKAEKIINRLITQAVERIPKDGELLSYSVFDRGAQVSNRLPENPTIEDLMNYIKNCLDLTPDEKGDGIFNQIVNTISSGYECDFELAEGEENKFKVSTYSSYYDEDGYLLDIADYFLTDEEKEMKFVMKVTDNEHSSYGTSDKTKLFGYIDTYAKHMEKVIRHKHPSLTDAQITSIMIDAKNKVKYSDLPKPNANGIYSIDDTLAKLEELVLKYAEAYTV